MFSTNNIVSTLTCKIEEVKVLNISSAKRWHECSPQNSAAAPRAVSVCDCVTSVMCPMTMCDKNASVFGDKPTDNYHLTLWPWGILAALG